MRKQDASPERVDMDVARPLLAALPLAGLLFLFVGCADSNNISPAEGVRKPSPECAANAIPNRFIVKWKDGSTSFETASDAEALRRDLLEPYSDEIEYAEHDYVVRLNPVDAASMFAGGAGIPDDDWGVVDIDAAGAWTFAKGAGVTVAVIDSGADIEHPQLKNQLAVNTGEIPGNGIDDDANGLVDDVYGYDFYLNNGNIGDRRVGHGTHVAGIVLAEHTDNSSVKGVAPEAKLLPLNFMNKDGEGSISQAMMAIDYAVRRGAKIINASWGAKSCDSSLRNMVNSLEERGVLFVAAAGNGDDNGGFNLESKGEYPAAFNGPAQLTVGAVTPHGFTAYFSNYSDKLVHLMAPGWAIKSAYPSARGSCVVDPENPKKKLDPFCQCPDGSDNTESICFMNGTSMATPFVSGAAAVLWSYRPKATVAQIRAALIAGVTKGDYLAVSHGRLNLKKAIEALANAVSQ